MKKGTYIRTKEHRKKMSEIQKRIRVTWKGGKHKFRGRWMIYQPNHPFAYPNGYIRQSRLVMGKIIGRYLKPEEIVHHIGEKDDDRSKMLILFPNQSEHLKYHYRLTLGLC